MNQGGNPHDFDDSLVDHAERCWKAECDNAERISKERHLILTVLIAYLGLGLFKVDWLQAVVSRTAIAAGWSVVIAVAIAVLLLTAAYYFVRALLALAHKPSAASASEHLSLPERAYRPAGALSANEQRRLAFARTYRAYQVLQERNRRSRERLSDAWTHFGFGISLVALVVGIYIATHTVSILTGDGSEHGSEAANPRSAVVHPAKGGDGSRPGTGIGH